MYYPRDNERYVSIVELRELTSDVLLAYDRHHLSGTPYNIDMALELVTELAVDAYVNRRDHLCDELLSNRVDTEVVTFLTEEEDDEGDIVECDIDIQIYGRMITQSTRAIENLYEQIAPSITAELRDYYDFSPDELYIDVLGTELSGRNTLSFCLEFSKYQR